MGFGDGDGREGGRGWDVGRGGAGVWREGGRARGGAGQRWVVGGRKKSNLGATGGREGK